eukprot:jgi/Tetstr1/458477/TSEL_004331.t1
MWHMLQGAVIHYLRDCEECDAPDGGEECRRVNEYIKKQREEGFNCLLTYAQISQIAGVDTDAAAVEGVAAKVSTSDGVGRLP